MYLASDWKVYASRLRMSPEICIPLAPSCVQSIQRLVGRSLIMRRPTTAPLPAATMPKLWRVHRSRETQSVELFRDVSNEYRFDMLIFGLELINSGLSLQKVSVKMLIHFSAARYEEAYLEQGKRNIQEQRKTMAATTGM